MGLASLVAGCAPSSDHGHDHGPGGAHAHAADSRPVEEITVRLDSIEVFVKYSSLIQGSLSTFETYVTLLDIYQPVGELSATINLIKDGKGIRHTVDSSNSNSVYLPALRPNQVGMHRLTLDLIGHSEVKRRIELGQVEVFATEQEAIISAGHADDSDITFSKKQAWDIDFQTAVVKDTSIYKVINTSGLWSVAPGDSKTLVANANGIISYNENLLTEGALVKKGQALMTITSRGLTNDNLEVEIEKAKADHGQITAEYERQKILFESNLIPKAEFERSESKYLVSKASIESLQQGYVAGGKQIQVPFDGFVTSINVHNGDYVRQGVELFTVVSLNPHILEVRVSPFSGVTTESVVNVWFREPNGQWYSMNDTGGSILSVGQEVSEEEPLLPLYAKVNTSDRFPHGSFTEVQIGIGPETKGLVVPESALLEEYGAYSVIVQNSGERFEKRPVILGIRNGQLAEVVSGLDINEVVVARGAYQVKMASMSASVPGHGHEH